MSLPENTMFLGLVFDNRRPRTITRRTFPLKSILRIKIKSLLSDGIKDGDICARKQYLRALSEQVIK